MLVELDDFHSTVEIRILIVTAFDGRGHFEKVEHVGLRQFLVAVYIENLESQIAKTGIVLIEDKLKPVTPHVEIDIVDEVSESLTQDWQNLVGETLFVSLE